MNLGQMMLAIGALALIGSLQLGILSTRAGSSMVSWHANASLIASSSAETLLDEIREKQYDEAANKGKVYTLDSLTPAGALGIDSADEAVAGPERMPWLSQQKFDDIDDYNGYSRIVSDTALGDFLVEVRVLYVDGPRYNVPLTYRTWFKSVIVRVTHRDLPQAVTMRTLIVYGRYF